MDCNIDRDSSCSLQGMTLQFRMTEQAAAVVIQREIRKYLGGTGFYEAAKVTQEQPELFSPDDRVQPINLYIK